MKGEMIVNGVELKENIIVHNASENNLKNITVRFPLNKFTCVTGPSGCGKSSLVFDTVYAESQRGFLESMSGNMFGQKLMDKPKVESIDNLRPALNISQNYYNVNPRSTVGTITDISYYLRTLYAFIINQEYRTNFDMNYFSPNNPTSCCSKCNGIGEAYVISEQAVMPDKRKKLSSGGILYFKGSKTSQEYRLLESICATYDINIEKSVSELTDKEKDILLYRETPETYYIKYKTPKGRYKQANIKFRSVLVELNDKLQDIDTPSVFANISKYLTKEKCPECNGEKLNNKVREYKICGYGIGEVEQLSMFEVSNWCNKVREEYATSDYYKQIINLLEDIEKRLKHLIKLKLEYISIGRSIPTLSGGELQRVRLATQLDCNLSGLVYILDEPCKGLHYKNIGAIIDTANSLVNKGNTIIAIEHNKKFISAAEHVIEMGPQGGPQGGYVLFEGKPIERANAEIIYKKSFEIKKYAEFKGITYHNLKNIDVRIPIGNVTCLSGVSGSGKSSLTDVIEQCCQKGESEYCMSVSGISTIKRIMRVNQQPIGKTARSTVVSYLGIYDTIRELFVKTDYAKNIGLCISDFSMNVSGGRCECCQGTGKKKIELSYLPETYVICPECKGKRFHEDVLSVKYKGYSIDDILRMSISDAMPIFSENSIYGILKCVEEIGLGYLSLGQMSMNLSGGEAQRIKLAKYLGLNVKGKGLYILDEPTSGLSEKDIELIINVINKLKESGETIVVIEHNLDFISRIADYLIDLGDKAGNAGGTNLFEGGVQEVINTKGSSWN